MYLGAAVSGNMSQLAEWTGVVLYGRSVATDTADRVEVRFTSDGSVQDKGFRLSYRSDNGSE